MKGNNFAPHCTLKHDKILSSKMDGSDMPALFRVTFFTGHKLRGVPDHSYSVRGCVPSAGIDCLRARFQGSRDVLEIS